MPITRIVARQIYDSRGKPTVEADVYTDQGKFRAAVPSGASTGIHEATELRDGGKAWMGQGVLTAVKNVNDIIAPALIGKDPTQQKEIDDAMIALDGTENKSKLGANAILAVSCAVSRAGAAQKGVPLYQHLADLAGNKKLVLPVPAFNVINGGCHAGNLLAMQEFMICPVGAATFTEAMQIGSEVYHELRALLKAKYGIAATNVGDEGGFAPNITSGKEALEVIVEAIKKAGYEDKVRIGVDSAASEFLKDNGNYDLNFKDKNATPDSQVTPAQLGDLYKSFKKDYPMIFFEDPFGEDDWDPSIKFTAEIDAEVIGDDSLCTNPVRIKRAIEAKNVNSLLLKINQIGTVTESIEAVSLAKGAGWGVLTSHRSGETGDDFIADLSVALATGKIKSGAPARYERLAKYNQFLRIEEELGSAATYAGWDYRYIAWEK